jgi:hypothetical protein
MDVKAIRDHLFLARFALGPQEPAHPLHPIAARLRAVERNLTPGDPQWHGDAVLVQTELENILSELEKIPKSILPQVVSGTEAITKRSKPESLPGVNGAIKQIGDAIELL